MFRKPDFYEWVDPILPWEILYGRKCLSSRSVAKHPELQNIIDAYPECFEKSDTMRVYYRVEKPLTNEDNMRQEDTCTECGMTAGVHRAYCSKRDDVNPLTKSSIKTPISALYETSPIPANINPEIPFLGDDVGSYIVALCDVREEMIRARGKFGPMHSAHEGWAVIAEELHELQAWVFMKQKNRDLGAMRKEAIEIAAMALCFAAEVCDEQRGRR